jgi:hydrophobic/amphiphilic exporter-1 (mainly G- bacteria), HAE1 family
MVFLALCVLGVIAWFRIPLELFPGSFSGSSLWIWVPYRDAPPREAEEQVLRPIEEHFSDIQGIKNIRANARTGNISFKLDFHRSMSMDNAYNTVVDRMERSMADLPEEVEQYFVFKWDASDAPILYAGIGIEGDEEEQYKIMEKVIKRRLSRIDGVGEVDAWGTDPKRVFIDFSRDELMSSRMGLWEIIQKLQSDNFQLPSGRIIEDGKVHYLRSIAKYSSIQELNEYPLREEVQLDDIASINYRLDPTANISKVDGKDGAGMSIRKESDANTVATTQAIKKEMEAMQNDPKIPVSFFTFFDQGELIKGALDDLKEAALTGGIFAIVTLFIFLRNIPMTILIAACIPFTLVISVAAMYLTGGSLNLLSLMGLMIAVGMVVDNAIVVVEGIYARRISGEEANSAAINGASEVALAITLSTMTTLAVFLPVILMNQDTDYAFFLGEIGFPISWALGASLLAALAFTPLTTTLLKAKEGGKLQEAKWIISLISMYQRTLHWILRRRMDAIFGLLLLSILTYALPFKTIGCSGDDDGGFGDFSIRYSIPPQYGYYDRVKIVEDVEAYVQKHKEEWDVDVFTSRLNGSSNTGSTTIYLNTDDPKIPPEEVLEIAKKGLPEIEGVKLWVGWDGSRDNLQFTLTLRGENLNTLNDLGEKVTSILHEVPGILSIDQELEDSSTPEVQLIVNRNAASKYGLSATDIGFTVGSALRANSLPKQQIDDKEVDVVARFQYKDRSDLKKLLTFPAWSNSTQQMIPLNQVVDIKMAPSIRGIERTNRQTAYPITINIDQQVEMDQVRSRVNNILASMSFPTGYGFDPPFDPDESADLAALQLSLVMSIALVFLIMGALFESFLLPMSIITTIPMAAFGAYWALYITGTPMDNIAAIGLIILIGVVVNNGIVLIELVTRLRNEGMDRIEALIQGGGRRLRPILMTALTTIFGLLPMAYGGGSSSGISYAPMGRVVAGGLAAGTLLTLFFVPLLYIILDDIRKGASRWVSWAKGTPNHQSKAETSS